MDMRDDEPYARITLKELAMNISFTYELTTAPEDIDENGYSHAIFKNLDLIIELNPYLVKNQVQVDISNL